MSDDKLIDPPARHTRQQDPNLGRRAFTSVAERMKSKNTGGGGDSSQERLSSSPGSPRRGRKKASERGTPQRRNQLYPSLNDSYDTEEETNDSANDVSQDISGKSGDIVDGRSPAPRHRRNQVSDSGVSGRSAGRRTDARYLETNDIEVTSKSSCCKTLILVFLAVLLIVIGFVLFFRTSFSEPVRQTSSSDYYQLFKPKLEAIKSHYPSQTTRFWRVVGSSLKRLLNEPEETYPSVFLFAISSSDSQVGTCISKDIVRTVNRFFNSSETGYINSTNFDLSDADKMKVSLQQRMDSVLDSAKGVVVDHIESIPAVAALLFHAYCDGDNAPYKRAVIILSLHSDKVRPNDEYGVENILNELWERDLGPDEMPALRSRIANNIAIISTENDVSC